MTARARSRSWPPLAIIALLAGALSAPSAQAHWIWPFSSSTKSQHTGKTVTGSVQHPSRLVGTHARSVKPLGGKRPMPKTILSKRRPS